MSAWSSSVGDRPLAVSHESSGGMHFLERTGGPGLARPVGQLPSSRNWTLRLRSAAGGPQGVDRDTVVAFLSQGGVRPAQVTSRARATLGWGRSAPIVESSPCPG